MRSKSSQAARYMEHLQHRLLAVLTEPGVDTILIPVNYGRAHWCGIIVDTQLKCIFYYDSLDMDRYKTSLFDIAKKLILVVFDGYATTQLCSPIQSDSYSCGFFVAMKFWRHVDRGVSETFAGNSMITRRFEFMELVMFGDARSDDNEEKAPASGPTNTTSSEVEGEDANAAP